MKFIWKFPFELNHIDKVVILTEGGEGIGYGHITRSVGVFQYLKKFGLDVDMFVRGKNIKEVFFEGERYLEQDWLNNLYGLALTENTVAFVDSYFVDNTFYDKIYTITKKLIIFDDYGRLKYNVGYILNPVVGKDFYNDYDKVLFGEGFIFLRESFWDVTCSNKDGDVRNILVTLGGNPPMDMLQTIIKGIRDKFQDVEIRVLSDPIDNADVVFTGFVDSKKMVELLCWADLAISAGGQTLHELFYLKVPTFMLKLADNQEYNIRFYEKRGFVRSNVDKIISDIEGKLKLS